MKLDASSLFKVRVGKPITYQEAHDTLLEAFDDAIEHETGDNNVFFSDFDDPLTGSLLDIWMDTYIRERIGERFHLSFDEFLDRPRYEITRMLSVVGRYNTAVSKALESEERRTDKLEQQLHGNT